MCLRLPDVCQSPTQRTIEPPQGVASMFPRQGSDPHRNQRAKDCQLNSFDFVLVEIFPPHAAQLKCPSVESFQRLDKSLSFLVELTRFVHGCSTPEGVIEGLSGILCETKHHRDDSFRAGSRLPLYGNRHNPLDSRFSIVSLVHPERGWRHCLGNRTRLQVVYASTRNRPRFARTQAIVSSRASSSE